MSRFSVVDPSTNTSRFQVMSSDAPTVTPKVAALQAKQATAQKDSDYANSPLGLFTNTIAGLPKAAIDTATGLGQGIARTVGAVGITAGNLPTQIANTGLTNKQPLPFDQSIPTTGNPISNALFGGQPITTLQKQSSDISQATAPYVGNTTSKFLAPPLVAGSVALDLMGLGGSAEKGAIVTAEQLVKHFAEEKSPQIIEDTLLKTGMDATRAADLAPKLASATTEQGVKDILTGQRVTIPTKAVDKVAEAKATQLAIPEESAKGGVTRLINTVSNKIGEDATSALRSIGISDRNDAVAGASYQHINEYGSHFENDVKTLYNSFAGKEGKPLITDVSFGSNPDNPLEGMKISGEYGKGDTTIMNKVKSVIDEIKNESIANKPVEPPTTKPLFESTAEKMATPFETVNAKATDAMPPEEVLPTVKEDGLPLPPETKNKVSFPITGTTEKEMVQSAIANSERAKTMLNVTGKDAYAASRALSPEDLKLAEKYDQGVPISELAPQATNPTKFAAFMDKLTNYYDLRLAADRASGGDTGFVSSYIPHEWDLTKPTDLEKFNQYAKQKGIAPYNGFRAQPRVFGSYAEGEAKGFTRANANIAEDLKSDYQKASSVISKQVLREGLRTAAPGNVSLSGFGRTAKGAPFINSNIKGLGGMSYAPEVSNLLKGFEPLTNQDFIQMAKEDAKTAGGGFTNLAKALPASGKEAGLGNVLGSLYDHANQPLKHIILNLSGFHSINISGSFAGASVLHPLSGAKGLALSVPSFFSEKVTQAVIDSFKGKMLGDTGISSFDGMMQIGVNLDRGIAKQAGSVFTHPLKSLSAAMFDRELYTLKLNLGDQVVGDLVKKGIPLDSPTARAYGNEVNLIMGEMNGRISNINPNTQKWLTRALLAPGFTESKYAVLAHSLTRGKASAGNFARTAVIGKSLVIGTLATLGTLLATGKFPNLHQLLLNYSVNPSSQTNIRNPKGQLKDVGFPKTYIDEPLGMIQDPGSYFRARFAPALTNIYESLPPSVLGTGKNYFGQPIVNPKSKTPGWLQTVSNIGIGDLPIGLQNLIGLEQKELTMPEAAIGVAGLSTHLRAKGTNTGGPRFQVQ